MIIETLSDTFLWGLGHKARHGKDFVAAVIAGSQPGVQIVRLSDAIKIYCQIMFGMHEKDPALLQRVGTDFRQRDPDIWIRVCYNRIRQDPAPVVIVPDIRFPNEAHWIKAAGGYLTKVTRTDAQGRPYISADRDAMHPSETALDGYTGWDQEIRAASGALDHLAQQACQVYADLWAHWIRTRHASATPTPGAAASVPRAV